MRTTHVYRVSKRFVEDHWSRELGHSDRIVHETKSHYFVRMTDDNASDLLSDAEYYADPLGFGPDLMWLVSAGRGTAHTMRKQLQQVAERGYTDHDRRFAPGHYEEATSCSTK